MRTKIRKNTKAARYMLTHPKLEQGIVLNDTRRPVTELKVPGEAVEAGERVPP